MPKDGPAPEAGTAAEIPAPRQVAGRDKPHLPRQRPHPGKPVIRFVAFGDGGTGGAMQFKVARAVAQVCADRGCDFALYLGDNIYEIGTTDALDEQFVQKFELPYADLNMPFYVVLGNHDYGSGVPTVVGLSADQRTSAQIEYTAHSSKWTMPARYYTFSYGPAQFFGIDSSRFVYDPFVGDEAQQRWLDEALTESTAPWKIVFGHHPYIANGYHGNAGNYGGLTAELGSGYADGRGFKSLVEHSICDRAQVYLAGHDHHREWLEPVCGTTFLISGASAKLRPVLNRNGQPTRFQDGQKHGFLWVELDPERFTGIFFDEDAVVDYRDNILLNAPPDAQVGPSF